MSITDYGKAKLEVVEKSKNKKHRRTYEPRGLDVVPWRKKLETQRPWYTTLRQSKANFDKPNGRERDRSMEERYVDGRHRQMAKTQLLCGLAGTHPFQEIMRHKKCSVCNVHQDPM